ncbi:MAG: flagellar motor protein MotD [Pseudomonadota bacterium]
MARSTRRLDPENHDRWLISYADFITLLFAFFVVMYALSSVNENKYKVFSASLTTAFGGAGAARSDTVTPLSEQDQLLKSLVDRRNARIAERQRKQQESVNNMVRNLNEVLTPLITSGQVTVSQSSRGVVLEINASALFNMGEAELRGNSVKTLAEVAAVLKGGEQLIEVEGFTDDVPINTVRFPSNWELSSARASSVVRLFVDRGVMPSRLSAVGSASNHPVSPNDTAEGRARNRRITVTVLSYATDSLAQQAIQ